MKTKVDLWVAALVAVATAAGGFVLGRHGGPVIRVETEAGEALEKTSQLMSGLQQFGNEMRQHQAESAQKEILRRSLVSCRVISVQVEEVEFVGRRARVVVELTPAELEKSITGMVCEIHLLDQFGDDRISEHEKIEDRLDPGGTLRHEIQIVFGALEWLQTMKPESMKAECEVSRLVYADGTVESLD